MLPRGLWYLWALGVTRTQDVPSPLARPSGLPFIRRRRSYLSCFGGVRSFFSPRVTPDVQVGCCWICTPHEVPSANTGRPTSGAVPGVRNKACVLVTKSTNGSAGASPFPPVPLLDVVSSSEAGPSLVGTGSPWSSEVQSPSW